MLTTLETDGSRSVFLAEWFFGGLGYRAPAVSCGDRRSAAVMCLVGMGPIQRDPEVFFWPSLGSLCFIGMAKKP